MMVVLMVMVVLVVVVIFAVHSYKQHIFPLFLLRS